VDTNGIARSLTGLFSFTHPGCEDARPAVNTDERFQEVGPCPQHNHRSITGCTSDWKAMLLNIVVVGKGYKMMANKPALIKSHTGYDSVSIVTL